MHALFTLIYQNIQQVGKSNLVLVIFYDSRNYVEFLFHYVEFLFRN